MKRISEGNVFKAVPARPTQKSDATTQAAREIIDKEVAARVAKTERLRTARLAREASEKPSVRSARSKSN